jgi:hypothetical protein
LIPTERVGPLWATASVAPVLIKSRILALVDMMKVNMSIHRINVDPRYRDHELYRESVIPYLEMIRFRPHLLRRLALSFRSTEDE